MGLATMFSPLTTGLLITACIPKIADCGGFKIGVPIKDPNTPPLEIVKVPPAISSAVILPSFPLLLNSSSFFYLNIDNL